MVTSEQSPIERALGGSIVAEELKGAPGRAAELAAAALASAPDARAAAAARTDLGLCLLLQGLPGAAQAELARAAAQGTPEIALLAGLYDRMAAALRFNAWPDGQGASATEIAVRWNAIADEGAAAPRLDALAEQVPGSPVLRLRRLTRLLGLLPPLRNTLELMRTMPDPPPGVLDMAVPELLGLEDEEGLPPAWIAYGRLAAADACRRGGDVGRALELLGHAREAYEQAGDSAGSAVCRLALGDWHAAPFSSPLCWNLCLRESASEGSELDWRVEEAEFGVAELGIADAENAYDEAEAGFAAAGAGRGLAGVALRRGYLTILEDDFESAGEWAEAARARFEAAGDVAGMHLAAIHRALAAIGAGALSEDRDAAAAAGRWGAGDGSFSFALGLGLLCGRAGRHWRLRRGDAERALACHRLAVALYEPLGAQLNVAQSLVDQADVLRGVGDAAGATVAYERAVGATAASSTAVAAKRGVLLAVEVAQLHHARQDADGMVRAAARLRERLAAFDPGAEPDGQAIATLAASQLSGLPTAIPLARAMALKEAGRLDEAAPYFAEALAASARSTDEQRDLHEASVLGSQERFDEALAAYRRYAAVRDGQSGFVAALARFLGPEQVARSRRQSLEQDLAFFTRVKAWAQARAAADELEQTGGPEWWQDDERPWAILSDLGEVAEGLGELERALGHYERAFDVYEARRGLLASEGLRTALGASKDVQWLGVLAARCALRLAEAGDAVAPARAFALAERGKARVLLDLMARSAARTAGRLDEPEARRRWRELGARADVSAQLLSRRRAANAAAAEIAVLEQRLGADQAALRATEEQLALTDPAWLGGMRATGEVAPLDEVAAAVPAGAALLQWVFLGRNLLAWAITGDGMVSYTRRELDARALGRAIRELRSACEGRFPAWEARAAVLAEPLLEPFAGVLADHERVIFVPYGVAHELPLHVLPFEGAPLAATRTVSALPSASVLPHLRTGAAARAWRVLAVGNPARMSHRPPGASRAEPAPPLRGAEAEAELAAAAFPDGVALTGEAATEPAVRRLLGEFPVLHLATHGILDQDAPGMSSVLLADGDELSVYELAGLELDVDLAVLSACRTGQGETTRGDDVVGLARGLLGAGCRAAVVSLWPVDDASTTLLMAAFYRELRSGAAPADSLRASALHVRGLSRADAAAELAELRTAVPEGARDILGLRRAGPAAGYDHPYHWAPFALVGTGLTGRGTT